jgi:hypothetical protein
LLIITGTLAAQVKTFVPDNGDWEVDANWSPAGQPTANDIVIINSQKTCFVVNPGAVAKSVLVDGGANLILVGGDLTIESTLDLESSLAVVIENGATVTTNTITMVSITGGTLTVKGTLNVTDLLNMENSGALNVESGGQVNVGTVAP